MLIMSSLLLSSILIIGCAAMSGEKPPGKFEQVLFVTETNYVEVPVTVEKQVWATNYVPEVVTITNILNETVTVTNIVPQFEVSTISVTETQTVPVFNMTPNTEIIGSIEAVGGILGGFNPVFTLIAGGISSALVMWGKLRSRKKAGVALAENIQAIRQFVLTLPQGAEIDSALKMFMSKHQAEAGATSEIVGILGKHISDSKAKLGATEIRNLIAELSK